MTSTSSLDRWKKCRRDGRQKRAVPPALNAENYTTMFGQQRLRMPPLAYDTILRAIDMTMRAKHTFVADTAMWPRLARVKFQAGFVASVATGNEFSLSLSLYGDSSRGSSECFFPGWFCILKTYIMCPLFVNISFPLFSPSDVNEEVCNSQRIFGRREEHIRIFLFFSPNITATRIFTKRAGMFDSRCQHEYMHRSQIETSVRANFFVFQQVSVDKYVCAGHTVR